MASPPIYTIYLISTLSMIDYTNVHSFQNPISAESSVLKFDNKFHNYILSAWNNAEKAKKEAYQTSISFLDKDINFHFTFTDKHYKNAISDSIVLFSRLKSRLVSDGMYLDKLGVDNENNTAVSRQKYHRFLEIAKSFEKKDSSKCSDDKLLENRIQCINSETGGTAEKIKNYNRILALDENSVLNKMEELHNDFLQINNSMHKDYFNKNMENVRLFDKLEKNIQEINNNDLKLILKEHQNTIDSVSESFIKADRGGTFSQKIIEINKNTDELKEKTEKTKTMFENKDENYLFNSIQSFILINNNITNEIFQSQKLISDAEQLREDARIKLNEKLSNCNRFYDLFYQKASEYYNSAENQNTGKAIVLYAEGIKFIDMIDSEDFDFQEKLDYSEKLIKNLENENYDVSFEKKKLESIKNTEKHSRKSAYVSLLSLIEQLKEKSYNIVMTNRQKMEKSQNLLNSAEEFLNENYNYQEIMKLIVFTDDLQTVNNKDEYLFSDEISKTCYEITSYYEKFFFEKSQEVVTSLINWRFVFDNFPECNKETKTKAVAELKNTLPFEIKHAEIVKNELNTEIKAIFNNILSGRTGIYEKEFQSTPLKCTPQNNSVLKQGNETIYYVKITAESPILIEEAVIDFIIPNNISIVSVFPESTFSNGKYIVNDLLGKRVIIISYVYSESPVEQQEIIFSNTTETTELDKINFQNELSSICLLTDCSDIKSTSLSDFETAENKLEDKKEQLAYELTGEGADFTIKQAEGLLKQLAKAIDNNTEVIQSRDFSVYSEKYLNFEERINYLKQKKTSLKTVSSDEILFQSNQLKEYSSDLAKISTEINSSISSLKLEANSVLNNALKVYENNPKKSAQYIEIAKQELQNGYYLRSIVYSDYIIKEFNKKGFPYQYILIGLVIAITGFFILKNKKAKKEDFIQERKLHSI